MTKDKRNIRKIRIFNMGITMLIIFILNMVNINSYSNIVRADIRNFKDGGSSINIETGIAEYEFPVIIRDFKADHVFFQKNSSYINWGGKGDVEQTLGEDRKPVFTQESIQSIVKDLCKVDKKGKKNINSIIAEIKKVKKEDNNGEMISRLKNITNSKGFCIEGTYEDAKSWYEENSSKSYENIKSEINTAYRLVYYFTNSFFNDASTVNTRALGVADSIVLKKEVGSDVYTFDSDKNTEYINKGGFFPLDGLGFGNEVYKNSKGESRNYHFSLESHSKFFIEENKTLEFDFKGDDDVWAYVDNQLVIDLGGIHSAQDATFKIEPDSSNKKMSNIMIGKYDKKNNLIGYETIHQVKANEWYNFDFFYMERHTTESNLKIETNIGFKSVLDVEKAAYKIDESGREVDLEDGHILYPGETVYYKFKLINSGGVDFTNIAFRDDLLNVYVDSTGVYDLSGNEVDYNRLEIKKNGQESIADSQLNELALLKAKTHEEEESPHIEVKSRDFLKKEIYEEHVYKELINTVIGSAEADLNEHGKVRYEAQDTISVKVENLKNEFIDVDINKNIAQITRNEKVIYPNEKSIIPNIKPEDKVIFKFDIKNNSNINSIPVGIENIELNDILAIGDNATVKSEWVFLKEDNSEVNVDNIYLKADELLTLYTEWNITYDEANNYKYSLEKDVTNTITLTKNIIIDGNFEPLITKSSEVKMKIEPVNLIIQKDIQNLHGIVDNSIDSDKYFTIKVVGSDETEYIVEAQPGKEYILKNLRYGTKNLGVNYVISEIVPMNYELVNISNKNVTLNVKNNKSTDDEKSIITNRKINESYFFDENIVTNNFTNYTKK